MFWGQNLRFQDVPGCLRDGLAHGHPGPHVFKSGYNEGSHIQTARKKRHLTFENFMSEASRTNHCSHQELSQYKLPQSCPKVDQKLTPISKNVFVAKLFAPNFCAEWSDR